MATKDTEKKVVNEEAAENTEATKLVSIRLPLTREKQADVFVGINGKTWLLKRGVDIEVPESVAEVLKNSEKMDMLALERSQMAKK